MPTEREQQILNLIRQNPMITQKELAKLLGITRPGVASHISRLIQEGLISGKGYVFPRKKYVTVIGAVNMDIYGIIREPDIILKGSNSGYVKSQLGGIGRNIAANLVELGINTNLITVFCHDANGEIFKNDSVKRGINISYSKQISEVPTSNYVYINDMNGDRVIGVDDMSINNNITPDFLKSRLPGINASNIVIFDTNIPSETIDWLYQNVSVPMIAKSVSVTKVKNLIHDSINLDSLVINGIEGTILTKQQIENVDDARNCAKELYKIFHAQIFLYVDDLGLFTYTADHRKTTLYSKEINVINTNGVGASMAAALTYAKLRNVPFKEANELIVKTGELTMESSESVSENVNSLVSAEK